MDPRLTRLMKGFKNEDAPPARVKPMPLQVVHCAERLITRSNPFQAALMDVIYIAIFCLLRPGECCHGRENTPLQLKDVTFLIGTRCLNQFTLPPDDLLRATHSSITLDSQKNRERGETVGHGSSGHRWACPTKALARRCACSSRHNAPPNTPLCAVFYKQDATRHITPSCLTELLRHSAAKPPNLGFSPDDVTVRSLRAGGAMALLCGNVDNDVIRLVGRWKSDAMFGCLHAQALPLVRGLARTML